MDSTKDKGYEYEVRTMKISNDVDGKGKKGIIAGKLLGKYFSNNMIAPRMVIKVGGKNRIIRCVDLYDNKRIIIVEEK